MLVVVKPALMSKSVTVAEKAALMLRRWGGPYKLVFSKPENLLGCMLLAVRRH
jgi:hypothetical protein